MLGLALQHECWITRRADECGCEATIAKHQLRQAGIVAPWRIVLSGTQRGAELQQ